MNILCYSLHRFGYVFVIIITRNITLQDIEKKQTVEPVNAYLFFPFERGEKVRLAGLKKASLETFQNSLGID